ncbi:MAG: Gfo/Idh/MocA family protein [Thermogutta sp.]
MLIRRARIRRRAFLKWSAAIVPLVPTVVSSHLFGETAPSEAVSLGIIGTGRQTFYKNIPQFQKQPDCRIVALCDVDRWRLEQAKALVDDFVRDRFQNTTGCATYIDYHDLLAREDIDAVLISTPDHWHGVMALEAMKAGKDVALEKPIIRTFAEGKRLAETANSLNRVFRVDSEFRVGAPARRAYSILRENLLGKIQRVQVGVPQTDVGCPPQPEMPVPEELDYARWQGVGITQAPPIPYTVNGVHPRHDLKGRPGWMRRLNYCDGMITNWGTHLLNGALWCLGLDRQWPIEIEGTGTYPSKESFWNVLLEFRATYRFENGLTIEYHTERPYMRFEGEKGWIEAGFNDFKASNEALQKMSFPLVDAPAPRFTSEKRDFLDCVRTRQPTWEPAEVGHHVTSICLMGHIAIFLGEKLRWDPGREMFVGNDAANTFLSMPIVAPPGVSTPGVS